MANSAGASMSGDREALLRERDAYRIEADCALRDYDGLELSMGIAVEALQKIADRRPNKVFDPWASNLARATLAAIPEIHRGG